MEELDEYRDMLPLPDEAETELLTPVRYVEVGDGRRKERWHASSTVCPQCGSRLVEATAPDGEGSAWC